MQRQGQTLKVIGRAHFPLPLNARDRGGEFPISEWYNYTVILHPPKEALVTSGNKYCQQREYVMTTGEKIMTFASNIKQTRGNGNV